MSMLAGPKTKPSWVLNPRCSDWSKDQNKLGQKMLEKMGWSVGKGLGAKEQGPVEALRISFKADTTGLGAARKKEQEYWLQQQDNFQSLLANLNGGHDQNIQVKSLEEKSRTSRTRVHYHKFTRGKDLSRYSSKDLSCIIGSGWSPSKVLETSVSSKADYQVCPEEIISEALDTPKSITSPVLLSSNALNSSMELRSKTKRKRKNNVADESLTTEHLPPETDNRISERLIIKNGRNKALGNDENDLINGSISNKKAKKNKQAINFEDNVSGISEKHPKKQQTSKLELGSCHPDKDDASCSVEETNEKGDSEGRKKLNKKSKRKSLKVDEHFEESSVEITQEVYDTAKDKRSSSKKGKRKNKFQKSKILEEEVKEVPQQKKTKRKRKKSNSELQSTDTYADTDGYAAVPNTVLKCRKIKGNKEMENAEVDSPLASIESITSGRKTKRARAPSIGESQEEQASLSEKASNKNKLTKKKKKSKQEKHAQPNISPLKLDLSSPEKTVDGSETNVSLNTNFSFSNELVDCTDAEEVMLPDCAYEDYILKTDSDSAVDSTEERLTGIPKTKKRS